MNTPETNEKIKLKNIVTEKKKKPSQDGLITFVFNIMYLIVSVYNYIF